MSPCPICGDPATRFFAEGRDVEYRTTDERFTYASCDVCQTIFVDPPPVDRVDAIYPATYYSVRGGGNSLSLRIKAWFDGRLLRRVLRRLPGERLAVLDIGGGTGWMLDAARAQDARVVETHELDRDATARATAEAAGHVFHGQPIEQFRPDRRFDLILMLNILEHLADPTRVLRALRDCLTEHGLILIKTPNTDTLDRRLFQRHNWGGLHCPRHWVLFTEGGLVRCAQAAGLACVEVRYTQGAPQWTCSLLGWLADRGLISVTTERPMYRHPLWTPTAALAAAFDFARKPLMKTAQMFVLLRRAADASN